ncbi:hypothetical protein HDV05_008119 [Chytridiales sp. JEL 0842]|nr:hypothetical protein HDV05_008119 [Chytridiales sp. JEL 0842]
MSAASEKGLAVILGAGPGTGAAVARAFAKKGFQVALLARSKGSLDTLTKSIVDEGGKAQSFPCDLTSESSMNTAFKDIKETYKDLPMKIGVFNASNRFLVKPFLDVTGADVEESQAFFGGAFRFAQHSLRSMSQHQQGGTLIFTGATSSLRGAANFSAFSPTKFALRSLTQTLAKEFGPKGIHVAHVIVDGLMDTEHVKGMVGPMKTPDERIDPERIAEAFVYLSEQGRSCWTQEMDIRPWVEEF